MKVFPYAFLLEVGFEKIPCLVLKHILEQEEDFEDLVLPAWEHTANNLMYNKEDEHIVIYKKIQEKVTEICTFKVKKYYSEIVDKKNYINIEIHCDVKSFDKKTVEKVYISGIINKNELPEQIMVIDKPLFNIRRK